MDKNRLYYGDNLAVLREHIADESVDLIYLDPPFKSDADYNVLFREHGTDAASQIKAFEDTWRWDENAARAFQETVETGGQLSESLQAFRKLVGESDMLAYLSMMAPRLRELRRVLKPTGSIYLHCDPTASHYLKLLLDAVFGKKSFQSEVIWSYRRWPTKTKNYQHMHDVLLFYAKGRPPTFNVFYEEASESFLKRFKGKANILDKGATKKRPADHETPGLPLRDVWEMSIIAGSAGERLGYPTQKPLSLLERIIEVSSNEGGLVLDPFCGCGTTVDAAQKLKRRWIGIDITHLAINLIRHRLQDTYGEEINKTYDVVGEPTSVPDARILAEQDPYQFQWWALGLVGARPVEQKKGADKGIDGSLYFHDEAGEKTKRVISAVKSGKMHVTQVRELMAVVEREKAQIGVLISMHPPTKPMRAEAADAGTYDSPWGKFPKIQLLTVRDLLEGKRLQMPSITGSNVTFKKARRRYDGGPDQLVIREEPAEYGPDT